MAIIADGAVAVNLINNTISNVQANMLPLTFNLPTPYEIINTNNNNFKNLDIVIMDNDAASPDQQMGSVLFNASLPLITYSTEYVILNSINNTFSIKSYFDYIN